MARILHFQAPLDEAFQQITALRNNPQKGGDRNGAPGRPIRKQMGSKHPSGDRG
jgi:hypothetical protein